MAKDGRRTGTGDKQKGEKMPAGSTNPSKGSGSSLDPRIQREIGKHLRAHYDDVLNEPVPDKFMELLRQLETSVDKKKD